MSGIVGSKLNIRGSGLVGSLGTDGQHLLSAGAGKTNVFETAAGGGKGGQVVKTQLTAVESSTSTSAVAIGNYNAAITPSATSSKVFVIMYLTIGGNDNAIIHFQLFRNTTQIALGDADSARTRVTFDWRNPGADFNYSPLPWCVLWLDSPASTSEQTYSMKWSTSEDTVYMNRSWDDTDHVNYSRSPSSIILQEIVV